MNSGVVLVKKETAMELFKKTPMTFDGEDYEIRVLYDDTLINVVAFQENHPSGRSFGDGCLQSISW